MPKNRLLAILLCRCPVCLRGAVFHSLLGMNADCPHCGIHFERETGYFLNAMFFAYVIGFLILDILILSGSGTAVTAHIGGALGGFLFARAERSGLDLSSWAKIFFPSRHRSRARNTGNGTFGRGGNLFGQRTAPPPPRRTTTLRRVTREEVADANVVVEGTTSEGLAELVDVFAIASRRREDGRGACCIARGVGKCFVAAIAQTVAAIERTGDGYALGIQTCHGPFRPGGKMGFRGTDCYGVRNRSRSRARAKPRRRTLP